MEVMTFYFTLNQKHQ